MKRKSATFDEIELEKEKEPSFITVGSEKQVVTEVTIPDGVTFVDDNAFSQCTTLSSVTMPLGVTSIGNNAFLYCSKLSTIRIPEGVTSIGDHAFSCCTNLTSVEMPDCVATIGTNAFSHCISLRGIIIPKGVTHISEGTFMGCKSLSSVIMSAHVTSIGPSAFHNCTSLSSLLLPSGITAIDKFCFAFCTSLLSIVLPPGVVSIGDFAFSNCGNLLSITIPETVTTIGNSTFAGCRKLPSITIPSKGVTAIGLNAFQGCAELVSLAICSGVDVKDHTKFFGQGAFADCQRLSNISLNYYSDVFGLTREECNKVCANIFSTIRQQMTVAKNTIEYTIHDVGTMSRIEYMLWLMAIDIDEYVDDWKGPHSRLVTSYIFDFDVIETDREHITNNFRLHPIYGLSFGTISTKELPKEKKSDINTLDYSSYCGSGSVTSQLPLGRKTKPKLKLKSKHTKPTVTTGEEDISKRFHDFKISDGFNFDDSILGQSINKAGEMDAISFKFTTGNKS